MTPREQFGALPAATPQAEIQRRLQAVHRRHGLAEVMECLFAFELHAGYITREALERVERLAFADPETGLELRIQVNYARSRYSRDQAPGTRPRAAGSDARAPVPREAPPPGGPVPSCLLCRDNVGRPGKEALRIYEFPLAEGRPFFLQLTPFPLFSHHFVLILTQHRPQSLDAASVTDMLDFLDAAPGYTACSNSDVEWAGSSILSHLHYQVFKELHLPVMDARALPGLSRRRRGCTVEALHYPLTALRITCSERSAVQELGATLIGLWKAADPGRNTVNLVLVRGSGEHRLTVLLRNPDFRTPEPLRRLKSEGVGVIEASGEAILPVPAGPEAPELWREIRQRGLAVVKGILAGNSPGLEPEQLEDLLRELTV